MTALAASSSALGAPSTNLGSSIESPPRDDQHLLFLGMCYGVMPVLYGVLLYQAYRYSRLHPADTLWLKGLVYGLLLFETTQFILFMDFVYFVYHNIVTHSSDPLSLSVVHQWTTRLLAPAMVATIVLCQSFYAYRVYRIGPLYMYRPLVVAAIVFVTCTLGYTIASAVAGFRFSLSGFGLEGVSPNPTIIGFMMLADNCLTGTLVVLLLRDRPSLKRVELLPGHQLNFYVNASVFMSALGLPVFIFSMTRPRNFIHIGFSLIGAKLYANTVLAVINARQPLSNRTPAGFEMGMQAEDGTEEARIITESHAEHDKRDVASFN